MNARYFKPRSVTWWAGVFLVVMGATLGVDEGYDIGAVADVIRAWTEGIGPAALIGQGLGLIGLRGALGE
jgi:hypothetical protein